MKQKNIKSWILGRDCSIVVNKNNHYPIVYKALVPVMKLIKEGAKE